MFINQNKKNLFDVCLEEACLASSSTDKILGITVDFDVKCDKHVCELCDEVSKKLYPLCRIRVMYRYRKTQILTFRHRKRYGARFSTALWFWQFLSVFLLFSEPGNKLIQFCSKF